VRLLDTNIVSALVAGNAQALARFAAETDNIAISAVVAEEIIIKGFIAEMNNVRGGKSKADIGRLYEDFCDTLRTLCDIGLVPYTAEAEQRYRELKKANPRLPAMDGRIAAHALVLGCVLVTENVGDFAGIPGLQVETWL
jgi:tRNA(fMet)-specific endonuclease VapC